MRELEFVRHMVDVHPDDPYARDNRERKIRKTAPVLLAFAEAVDALFLKKRGPAEEFLLQVFGAHEDLHKALAEKLGPVEGCEACELAAAEAEYQELTDEAGITPAQSLQSGTTSMEDSIDDYDYWVPESYLPPKK